MTFHAYLLRTQGRTNQRSLMFLTTTLQLLRYDHVNVTTMVTDSQFVMSNPGGKK